MASSSKLLVGLAVLLTTSTPYTIAFAGINPRTGVKKPSRLNADKSNDIKKVDDFVNKVNPDEINLSEISSKKKNEMFGIFSKMFNDTDHQKHFSKPSNENIENLTALEKIDNSVSHANSKTKKSTSKNNGIFSFITNAIEEKKEKAGFLGGGVAFIPPGFLEAQAGKMAACEREG